MGLNIKGIALDFGRSLIKPFETGKSVGGGTQDKFLLNGIRTANFLQNSVGNLDDGFAYRSGLSTAIDDFNLQFLFDEPALNKPFDGRFVGAKGQTFRANTRLCNIPAVIPNGGIRNNETMIYINGIRTNVAGQAICLQVIADKTGSRLVGIYNATEGIGVDALQNLGDKLDIGKNPSVDTLADAVYKEIIDKQEVHLLAHSHGAIITSRALEDVKNRLMLEDRMCRPDAERLMGIIKVETFGSLSRRFPDGPQYVHYFNRSDGDSQSFSLRSWLNPVTHRGQGAVTRYFRQGRPLFSHGFEEFYLPERVPFKQLQQAGIAEIIEVSGSQAS